MGADLGMEPVLRDLSRRPFPVSEAETMAVRHPSAGQRTDDNNRTPPLHQEPESKEITKSTEGNPFGAFCHYSAIFV